MTSYRPDIDGLRAIAVLAVLGYHATDSRVPGGYVGVDIFFVISGYLISGILLRDHAAGRASLATFYARRIRRIFPALLLVLAVSALLGWALMFDFEFEQLGKHVAAGVAFVSNVALWRESGYFDIDAELKPLLHLWSLGIEEQFYLTWPPLLWLACRLKRPMAAAAGIVLLSFGANLATVVGQPDTSFFLPHTRAWELLLGAIVAIHEHDLRQGMRPSRLERLGSRHGASLLSAAGGLLLLVAVFRFDDRLSFPGWWALIPTAGSLMIIAAGPGAWLNRAVLARPAMVFVGLISYPLYLWHWPLLYFARITTVGNPSRGTRVTVVALAFLLSWLTYRWLEQPVRARRSRTGIVLLVAASLLLGLVGLCGWGGLGPSPRLGRPSADLRDLRPWPATLHRTDACAQAMPFPTHLCTLSTGEGEPTIVLIGDSHSNHLAPGLGERLEGGGRRVVNFGANGCPPLWADPSDDREAMRCRATIEPALDWALGNDRIDTVILASAWGYRMKSVGAERMSADLDRTLGRLLRRGKRVLFVHDTPDLGFDPRSCFNALRLARGPVEIVCRVERRRAESVQVAYRQALGPVLARHPDVGEVDPVPLLCDSAFCYGMRAGRILYRDHDHLSLTGSREIAGELERALDPS